MSKVQISFRIPIQDYLILDCCCRWTIGIIENKARLGKKKLNYKDEHYKKWIESIRNNIQDQVKASTSNADPQEFIEQFVNAHEEIRNDFIKVM